MHDGTIYKKGDLAAIDCKQCGLIHLDPLPSRESLSRYYSDQFYQNDKKNWLKEEREDDAWLTGCAKTELAIYPSPPKNLLDIGCGFGKFIEVACGLGYDAAGIEPSPYACKVLEQKRLSYWQGEFETQETYPASADIIRAAWVLEHCLDPKAILRKIHCTLKPDGMLSLTVPNDFSELQNLLVKEHGYYWLHKSHINYFNRESLFALLDSCGFVPTSYYASYPMEWFILQGKNYLGNAKIGREVHGYRKRMELEMDNTPEGRLHKMMLMSTWARIGIGRDLTVLARKK